MPFGLPSAPTLLHSEFTESLDDEHCPNCGWDREDALADPQAAFNAGILLAVEASDQSPFTVQAATTLYAYYWRCPNSVGIRCGCLFTTEEESTAGAMA